MPTIARANHADCQRLYVDEVFASFPGHVRRCVHGKIQLRSQVGPNAGMQGPGTDWWRTLSPVFTPVLYRRARKALT